MLDEASLSEKVKSVLLTENIILLDFSFKIVNGVGPRIDSVIFKKESSVSHDDCSLVTRVMKDIIFEKGEDADEFSITVSSPGLSRKLKSEAEYEIFSPAPVRVHIKSEAIERFGKDILKGQMLDYGEGKLRLKVEKDKIITININDIKYVKLNY